MSEDPIGAVFSALGDPTRRHLLESLTHGRETISGLASDLPLSRQAVTKHLTMLTRAGLVQGRRSGREVYFELTPEAMTEPARWMAELGAEWNERLGRLERLFPSRAEAPPPRRGSARPPGSA